ncbi:hypothetical protein SVAN01_03705 [Stagonosporopsis vannaccii]|nr:hypothetical protein SVAN01_03705 [Stagonosporopsis vannaccii]
MAYMWFSFLTFGTSFLVSSFVEGTSKPALILVPGAFHRAGVHGEVTIKLRNVGYGYIDVVELPSVGYDVAGIERTADMGAVTELLEVMLRGGDDIVLIGNSYGATVTMEAVKAFEDNGSTVVTTKKAEVDFWDL